MIPDLNITGSAGTIIYYNGPRPDQSTVDMMYKAWGPVGVILYFRDNRSAINPFAVHAMEIQQITG
jgi:hypothetical protein